MESDAVAAGGLPPGATWLPRLAAGLALLALGAAAVAFVGHAASLVTYPYEVDQFEGHDLFFGWRVAHGEALYPALDDYPYVENPYTPLHALVLGLLVRLFGVALAPGRLLSLLAMLGIAATTAAWIRRRAGPWPALGAVLLFLGTPAVIINAALIKADPLGNCLALLGLGLATGGVSRRRHLWIGGGLLVLAVMTKQVLLAAPAATLLWLAMTDRRAAWRFAAGVAGALGLLVLLLATLSHGQFLLHAVVYAGLPRFSLERVVHFYFLFFLAPALPLLLASGLLADPPPHRDPLLLYAGLEVVLAVTAGRGGSHFNYFLGPAAAVALAFGAALGGARVRRSPRLAALLWGLAGAYALTGLATASAMDEARAPSANLRVARRIDEIVRQAPADRPLLVEMATYALRNDRPWLVHAQTMLELGGRIDRRQLFADCRSQRFGLVVTKALLPRLLGSCLEQNYHPVERLEDAYDWTLGRPWTVYAPSKPPVGLLRELVAWPPVPLLAEAGDRAPEDSGAVAAPPSSPPPDGGIRLRAEAAGYVDLDAGIGHCQRCSAFVETTLVAEQAVAGTLLLGADNSVAVWLDGAPLFSSGLAEGIARRDAYRVPLALAPGRHRLVLRIDQLDADWGFYARLVSSRSDEEALPGVEAPLGFGEGPPGLTSPAPSR